MNRLLKALQHHLAIDGLDRDENRTAVRWGLLLAVLAVVVRIVFWAYTNRLWEDALITCLHSENFARGLGLTHVRPGEPPLHGFTSPLSVLVPLIGDLIHVGFGLSFIRLVSLPAAALTVIYVLAIGIHPAVRLRTPLIALTMGYLAFEHQQILFGMSGMETQLSVVILLASMYYLIAWKPVPLGITLGLCMLVRPDYGFWTLIVGGYILYKEPRQFLKIAGIAWAFYLPWIVFTTVYYGSPVPNTIIAKGLTAPYFWKDGFGLAAIKSRTGLRIREHLFIYFSPAFAGHAFGVYRYFYRGSERTLGEFFSILSALGIIVILFRRQKTLIPIALWGAVYSFYYIYIVPFVFYWYVMPYAAVMLLISLWALQWISTLIPAPRLRTAVLGAFTLFYVGLHIAMIPRTFYAERQIQHLIENKVRKRAGLYLAEHMKPDEAVGSESLGYLGYYSRGNVYDWPGMASRKVVAYSRNHPEGRCLEAMLRTLLPEYLFLRDSEFLNDFQDTSWIRQDYHPVAVFQVDPEDIPNIPLYHCSHDTHYRLYKKNRPDDPPPDTTLWPGFSLLQHNS